MYTLQVITDKLNIRSSPAADTQANWVGDMTNGAIFKAVNKVKGATVDGSDEWYVDDMNRFVSAAWVSEVFTFLDKPVVSNIVTPPVNYNALVTNIPVEWKNSGGKNINVAIFDTGCFAHDALTTAIVAVHNAINGSNDANDNSASGHGTFIAGLIGARKDKNVQGVAPQVNLIVVKVCENDLDVDGINVLNGLNWLKNQCPVKPHIINISLDFDPFPNEDAFKTILADFANTAVIFAAAQNDANLVANNIFYPAAAINVIGAGALNVGNAMLTNDDYKKINTLVKYIVPNVSFYSTNKQNTYSNNVGCSFSSAYTSGVAALALAFFLQQGITKTPVELLALLKQALPSIEPAAFTNDNLTPFKNVQL